MITQQQAFKFFSAAYPKRTITHAAIFDKDYYIVVGLEDPDKADYDDPFFLINKHTGEVNQYNPLENLKKFKAAFIERPIDLAKGLNSK